MALRQSAQALTEVPEKDREHYVEKDGRWVLITDPPTEDVTGLKSALDSERRFRRDAEAKLSEISKKFDGINPEQVAEMAAQLEGYKDKQVLDKDGMDALRAKLTTEAQRQVATKEREIVALRAQATELDGRWRKDRIQTAVLSAVTRAGVAKEAVEYAVSKGLTVFIDLDEHGVPLAKNGEDVRYGKDGVAPLSPDEWALSLRQEAPFLWPPSQGGGGQQSTYNGLPGTMDYSKLPPADRLTKYRQDQAARK